MDHKKTREELAFPITNVPKMCAPEKPQDNPNVIRAIIRGAVQGAYKMKTPSEPSTYSSEYGKEQQPLVSDEQIQFVCHLIESLQPADAIEAALASQFVITYIRGLETSQGVYDCNLKAGIQFFEFGHQVLDTLQSYRTKGSQLVNVQYNHNQGQINNIKLVESKNQRETIEVQNEL